MPPSLMKASTADPGALIRERQSEEAAAKIQAIQRGNLERGEMQRAKSFAIKQEAAAERIQAINRGRKAREEEKKQCEILDGFTSQQKTTDMMAQLEAAGFNQLTQPDALQLSMKFNQRLEVCMPSEARNQSWRTLMREIDNDASNLITFEQITKLARTKLKLRKQDVPDLALKALWCFLDPDLSDNVTDLEFNNFMGLAGATILKPHALEKRQQMLRMQSSKNMQEHLELKKKELALDGLVSTETTDQMRTDLNERGVPMPGELAIDKLSEMINKRLTDVLPTKDPSTSWLTLFKEVTNDESGRITFDEVRTVVRKKLRFTPKELADDTLKALWCVLDSSDGTDDDALEVVEFARFMRRAGPSMLKQGQQEERRRALAKQKTMKRVQEEKRKEEEMVWNKLKSSVATLQLKDELREKGIAVPMPDEEVWELSLKFNEHLDSLPDGRANGWIKLFREMDNDQSGLITFDEIQDLARKKLRLSREAMNDDTLKSLWCWLDEDNSDSTSQIEFSRFMDKAAPEKLKGGKDAARQEMLRQRALAKRAETEQHLLGNMTADRLRSSVPTMQMKAQLEADGVPLPEGDNLAALSKMFNEHVALALPDTRSGRGWYQLFKEVDDDASGLLTYDELETVTRKKMKISKKDLSDTGLKALWCVLDIDNSDNIDGTEFSRFMQIEGAGSLQKGAAEARQELLKQQAIEKRKLADEMKKADLAAAKLVSCIPTAQMRDELKAAGVALLDDDEVTRLSGIYNKKLEIKLPDGKIEMRGWIQLFRELDDDASGMVTFDEIKEFTRKGMRIKPAEISDDQIRALWVALDVDDSDSIEQLEFGRFMQRAGPESLKTGKDEARRKMLEQRAREKALQNEMDAKQQMALNGFVGEAKTEEMRKELTSRGVEPLDESALRSVAKRFTAKVEFIHPGKDKLGVVSKLFKEVDDDASGLITYDELRAVMRKKLKFSKADCSEDQLKALWCALDVDNSNNIAFVEFSKFIQSGSDSPRRAGGALGARQAFEAPMPSPRGKAAPLPPRPGSVPIPTPLTTIQRYHDALQKWPTAQYYQMHQMPAGGGYTYLPDPFYNPNQTGRPGEPVHEADALGVARALTSRSRYSSISGSGVAPYRGWGKVAPSSPFQDGFISTPSPWRSRLLDPTHSRLHMVLGERSPLGTPRATTPRLLPPATPKPLSANSSPRAWTPKVPSSENTHLAREYRRFYKWPDGRPDTAASALSSFAAPQ